MMYPCY